MICITGGERQHEALAHRLTQYRRAPLQEVRLDLLQRIDDAIFPLLGKPSIVVTCRSKAEGGVFAGSEAERFAVLSRALEQQPGYLDVELSTPPALRRDLFARRKNTRLILSYHHLVDDTGYVAQAQRLAAEPADLLKIVTTITSAAQLHDLLHLLPAETRPVIRIGMGPGGLLSRALHSRFGSPWTYVVADESPIVAPGQLTATTATAWRLHEEAKLVPLGLIGGPHVLQSPGPQVYNTLLGERGLPYLYLPVVVDDGPQATESKAQPYVKVMALLQELGFAGCSVTMPAKELLLESIAELSPAARRIAAINTLLFQSKALAGLNTDEEAVAQLLPAAAGRQALVLGYGGAARAAIWALKSLGCSVGVSGRHAHRAVQVAKELDVTAISWEQRHEYPFAALVNATPLGGDEHSNPMPRQRSWKERIVLDMVLSARPTPLLQAVQQGGGQGIAGHTMWIHQGARQMEALTGQSFTAQELGAKVNQLIQDGTWPGWTMPFPSLSVSAPSLSPTDAATVARHTPQSQAISLRVPGSKSQTQRALILAALAQGSSRILDPLDCDDTRHLRRALRELGVTVHDDVRSSWHIGRERRPLSTRAPLYCGEAGTALRFLAPLCLVVDGELFLEGRGRLTQRPIHPLVQALEQLGATAQYLEEPGHLPLVLQRGAALGDQAEVDTSQSSQFASGLLMVAPLLPRGLTLTLSHQPISYPYLNMTLQMMRASGAQVRQDESRIVVTPGTYHPGTLQIEGDWSSAAFMLAASWISGRPVQIENLSPTSLQGDRVFAEFITELSRPHPHHFDLAHCPDLIAPLAAAAAFAQHPVAIRQVAHARLKESDRLAVLTRELRRAGVRIHEEPDALYIEPGGTLAAAELDPARDHRMAMAFGLLTLQQPGIQIKDPGCVSKSYPSYWQDLARFAQ